jgi:hypothetical protein
LVSAAGIAPAVPRFQAEHVAATPRADGAPDGTCTHTLPADNGLLFYSATRAKWWEALVILQFVVSSFILRHPIYSRATGSPP